MFDKIAKPLTFMLKTNFLIRLLENFLIAVVVNNNKIKNGNGSKVDEIDKILKNIKNLRKSDFWNNLPF